MSWLSAPTTTWGTMLSGTTEFDFGVTRSVNV
jgi:hypothetical protein